MEHQPNPNIYTDRNGQGWQRCDDCGDYRKANRVGRGIWVHNVACGALDDGYIWKVCGKCGDRRRFAQLGSGVFAWAPVCGRIDCPSMSDDPTQRTPQELINDLYRQE